MGYFLRLRDALSFIDETELLKLPTIIKKSLNRQGTIWLFGNGGSFANAQHWACDLQKVSCIGAILLGSNGSTLTAYSNDINYSDAVAEEFNVVSRPGDLLIVLSCSGCSPNITRLLLVARELYISSVLITGSMNTIIAQADLVIKINSEEYAIIEDCHAAIGHWLIHEGL